MTGDPKNSNTSLKIRIATVGAWFCVFLGFLVSAPALVKLWHQQGDWLSLNNLSEVGSYLQGAVASFWSLGGLLFIYATFLSQQKQISQQDRELADQKKQYEAQQESIKRQTFEAAFFQLLGLQNELVAAMVHPEGYKGRKCFEAYHKNIPLDREQWMRTRYQIHTSHFTILPQHNTQGAAVEFYENYYRRREGELGHYFRNLYHIFKFIKMSDIPDKRRYASLVRAQLSKFELFFLFYNCLSSYGAGFKPLIEEFGLLEHLDKSLLLDKSHESFYAESAYK